MNVALEELVPPVRLIGAEPISVKGFWDFCAENRDLRCERLPNGEIVVMSPTHGRTSVRNSQINRMLGNWAENDGRGWVLESNAGCELPDGSVLCPDAAWISASRWTPPANDQEDTSPPCPEFVIELRSGSDSLPELREKMQRWVDNGAELAWLIDPSRKGVEVYRPGREPEVLEGGSAVEGEGPVAGFVLELWRVWG